MKKDNHRITLEDFDKNEHRELLSVKRNQYGDLLFELEGGLTRQFTPRKEIEPFAIDRVYSLRRSRMLLQSVLFLKNPNMIFHGDIRDYQTPAPDQPKELDGVTIQPGAWAQSQGVSVITDGAQIGIRKKGFPISGPERWEMLNSMVKASDPEGWTVLRPKAKTAFSGTEIYKHIECEGVKKSPRYRITARAVTPQKREVKKAKQLTPEEIKANRERYLK